MTSLSTILLMTIPWQCYALGSVLFSCLEDVGDRYAINIPVQIVAASFIRLSIWIIIATSVMCLTPGHHFFWTPTPTLLLLGAMGAVTAIAYSRVLTRISVSTLSVFAFIMPLLFLVVDKAAGYRLTAFEVLAILGMVLGGIGFGKDEPIRMDRWTILAFVWMVVNAGIEAYYVKYMHDTQHTDNMGILLNMWSLSLVFLIAIMTYKGYWKELAKKDSLRYMRRCLVSKGPDVCSTLMWSAALSLAAVSQISAVSAFYPLIMLILVWIVQGGLKVNLGEDLRIQAMTRKSLSACLLVLSILVV